MSAEHYETGDVPPAKNPSRGVYWLPNVFTTGTLFGGFYAIVAAINGDFSRAGIAIFVAMLFDGLDGRVARWTNTQSDFGKEYDSLCDMVAFGVAPAIVAYQWGIERIADYGKFWTRFGWLAAFFYAVAAALRLARFNARAASADKRYFEGLPSPSAAATVASFVWLVSEFDAHRPAGVGARVRHHDLHRRADGQPVLVLERQGTEHARAHSVGVRRADPADLRHRLARARIVVRVVRGLCVVGAAVLAVA